MSTRVRRKFSGPSGILTVSTFLYNLSLSFILGAFVHAAVQAVPLPKKADFYASAAQAQQSPYLSAACFSVLLFSLFTVPRLFAAVCIFSRKRPKAAYPKYAVLEAEL
jgi:hypothetical protein